MKTLRVPLLKTEEEFKHWFFHVSTMGNTIEVASPEETYARMCQAILEIGEKAYEALAKEVPETDPSSFEYAKLREESYKENDGKGALRLSLAVINAVIEKYNSKIVT